MRYGDDTDQTVKLHKTMSDIRVNHDTLIFDTQACHWQPLEALHPAPNQQTLYWLTLSGSLTAALKSKTSAFSVVVLKEAYLELSGRDCGLNHDQTVTAFSRQTLLMNGVTPWVSAHTLISQKSLENGLNDLTGLNNQPLGEVLFTHQDTLKQQSLFCQSALGWSRRTNYLLQGQPLSVSECFLPSLIDHD